MKHEYIIFVTRGQEIKVHYFQNLLKMQVLYLENHNNFLKEGNSSVNKYIPANNS